MTENPEIRLADLLHEASATQAVQEIESRCRRLLRSKFGSNPLARQHGEDLVQEVLMAAFRQARKVDAGDSKPIKNLNAWLCRVTMNAVWRRWHREGDGQTATLSEALVAVLPEPETLATSERLAVRQALARLDEPCRRLLWLKDVLGEARQVLAEQVGTTTNALGVRLHRCRKKLYEIFTAELVDTP